MAGGIPANFLVGGIKPMDNVCVLNFHRRMYFDLTYARRQILVVIQAIFGHQFQVMTQDGREHVELIPAWPVDVKKEDFAQFIKSREGFIAFNWFKTVKKSLDHVNRQILLEQIKLHPGQNPPPELNNNQMKAKYLEMAASGFAYLEEVFDNGNELFGEYEEACQHRILTQSSGENLEIKQAALDIWVDKLGQLTAKVKKVLELKNWLVRVAEVYYDQREDEQLEQQLYQVLRRAYFRLYWTPDEVPMGDFINLIWKVLGFKFRDSDQFTLKDKQKPFYILLLQDDQKASHQPDDQKTSHLPDDKKTSNLPDDKKTWYDPETLKKKPTLIKGSLGELEIRRRERDAGVPAEDIGEPSIGKEAEPGENKKPDTKHKLNSKIFQLLQDLHREVLWGRRQIILVIQMIFGDLKQNKFEWPDEEGGGYFRIRSREGLSFNKWMSLMQSNTKHALDLLFGKQPEGEVRLEMPENNQKKAKYLGLALWGFEHIWGLFTKAMSWWGDFHTECKTLLTAMQKGSPERQVKQDKLDKLHKAVTSLLQNFSKAAQDGREKLTPAKKNLEIPDSQVNVKILKKPLSEIYFQFHPILDQVPLRMFCDFAYEIFGWNWTIAVKKEKKFDVMTWFVPPRVGVRIRRVKGIGRRKAEEAAKRAFEGGEDSSEEEGAAGGSP